MSRKIVYSLLSIETTVTMKFHIYSLALSVFLFSSAHGLFGKDLLNGWGLNVGGSAGIGGTGAGAGLNIGTNNNKEGVDYSGGTGIGVGGSLGLGPLGSIGLKIGIGSSGKESSSSNSGTSNVNLREGIWSWRIRNGLSNTGSFISTVNNFIANFPVFRVIEDNESPAALLTVYNAIRNDPNLLSKMLIYLDGQSQESRDYIYSILNTVLNAVPGSVTLDASAFAPYDATLQNQIRLFFSSLTSEAQQLLRLSLVSLNPQQQVNLVSYLTTMNAKLIGRGSLINISPSTLNGVVASALNNQLPNVEVQINGGSTGVNGGGTIEINGGSTGINSGETVEINGGKGSSGGTVHIINGGSISSGGTVVIPNQSGNVPADVLTQIRLIFQNNPDAQREAQIFWSRLSPETEVLLRKYVGGLPEEAQAKIMVYLMKLSEPVLAQPRIQVVLEEDSIKNLIALYDNDALQQDAEIHYIQL